VLHWPQLARENTFGECALLTLQRELESGEIRSHLHVRANGGNQTRAEIGGAANCVLPAMLGLAGVGAFAGGCPERRRVGYDPRSRQLRSGAESSGVGEPARNSLLVGGWRRRGRA